MTKWSQSADLACNTIQISNFAISIQTTDMHVCVYLQLYELHAQDDTKWIQRRCQNLRDSKKREHSFADVINIAESIEIMVIL